MNTRTVLRLEGLAVFGAATAAYFLATDAPWWLFALLALAPDLSMLGYLAGPVRGARAYNAAHAYVGPVALAGVGFAGGAALAVPVALVWAAHIGMDRALGYGLKEPTGFHETHLGRVGRSREFPESDGREDVDPDPRPAD